MDGLLSDLAYAARTLRKNAAFTMLAVLTIALGIGACCAIFSVVHAVLLRPLPYANAPRLVLVWGELRARNVPDWPFSPPDFRDLRQQTKTFDDMAGITPAGRVPIGGDAAEPEQIRVAGATPNVFRLLGARIAIGRDFVDDDALPQPPAAAGQPQAQLPAIAIISDSLWQRRYGGDSSMVGRTIEFGANGRAQIVGVLAPGFEILFPPRVNVFPVPDMWTAVRIDYDTANRNNVIWRVIGRLKPGVTIEQAQVDVDGVAADLRQHFSLKQTSGLFFHVIAMHEDLVRESRPGILWLMGAVSFVLLISCANVANLLIVRAAARGRELAIRAAIGGSRWRLVRQMLAESLIIAAGGTIAGLALARRGIGALLALGPGSLPRLNHIAIEPAVLLFTVGAGLLTAIVCGVVPALRASRPDLMDVLRQSGGAPGLRAGRAVRHAVIVVEVVLSFVLLVGSGLMVRSFVALQHVNPGFEPNGLLTFLLPPRGQKPEERVMFVRRVRERLQALPAVRSVTAATALPLDGTLSAGRWGREAALSDPSLYKQADFKAVLPKYFETLKTALISGRTFTEGDNAGNARLIIIDDRLAARAFPNESAVGKRLVSRVTTPEPEVFEVVGVVAHQRHASLAVDGPEGMFFTDGYFGGGAVGSWALRVDGDPMRLVPAVRSAVAEIDPKATLAEVQPMTALVDKAMTPVRFAVTLIGVFAVVAIVLAAVGLYGVLATVVRQRTAEIGMRMVFGARRASIFGLVIREGLRLSAVGVAIGLVVAYVMTKFMATLLVGVRPTDPATFASITALFFVIAAVACWLPAYRASKLDPTVALRDE
jgi:predicted permease